MKQFFLKLLKKIEEINTERAKLYAQRGMWQ
jgi:hypothetical protein